MDIITYALAKKYADKAIAGLGTIKGQDVIVKSIIKEDGVSTVTFEWLGASGVTETAQMIVADGAKGDPGEKGDPGIPGEKGDPGDSGLTSYFHVKYSASANPQISSEILDTPADYIGTYSDFNAEASTDPADYTWARFKGEQGEQGDPGAAAPRPSFTIDEKKHLIVSYDDGTTEDLGLMPSTDVELSTEEDNVLILKDGKLYVPKTDLSNKLDKKNPVATGSFSLGRAKSSSIGSQSLAIGDDVTASGDASSATGSATVASGNFSHAEGEETKASGDDSHAEGTGSVASGYAAHAEGEYTIAASEAQHVEGQFNVADKANKYAHIIGGGSSTSDRKNIHTVDWEGNAEYNGDVVAKNISLVTTEQRLSNNGYNSISGSRNLLNPSLQTSVSGGITCTNNGDGTYTLNGTNNTSNNITFPFKVNIPLSQKVKLVGCPKIDENTGMLQTQYNGTWGSSSTWDRGNGVLLEDCSLINQLAILIYPNAVLENVVFKPMITIDLNATYDNYEPYYESNKVLTDEVKKITVYGSKNLLNADAISLTTKSRYTFDSVPKLEVGKTYIISAYQNGTRVYATDIQFAWRDANDNIRILSNSSYFTDGTGFVATTDHAEASIFSVYVNNISGGFRFQIEEGNTATTYEKYYSSNKDVESQKANKSDIITNLLSPTLYTQTKNGVTCTNNGDGTFTVTGTATAATYFIVQDVTSIAKSFVNKTLYLAGCVGGSTSTYDLRYEINTSLANGGCYNVISGTNGVAYNNQITLANIESASVVINVRSGATLDNVIFKPILSTNPAISYNNFITYTGSTGNLSKDVAEIKKNIKSLPITTSGTESFTIDSGTITVNYFSSKISMVITTTTNPCPLLITNTKLIQILKENGFLGYTLISPAVSNNYYKVVFSMIEENKVYLDICVISATNRTYSIPSARGGLEFSVTKYY